MCPRNPREDRADTPAKNLSLMKLTEWVPGNTKDAPSERTWGRQGIIGATDVHESQVVYKGQRLRIQ